MEIKPTLEDPVSEQPAHEQAAVPSSKVTIESTGATRSSQPPPIPPRWTRPDFNNKSTTPAPSPTDDKNTSIPLLSDGKCTPVVECKVAGQPAIELQAALNAFANLTLNSTPTSPTPRAPARVYPTSPLTSPTKRLRFYSVTIGRRTGVFTNWLYVESLVKGVPGNKQISFKTEAAAYEHYLSKKASGEVKVVRVSMAEDDVFGPEDEAIE